MGSRSISRRRSRGGCSGSGCRSSTLSSPRSRTLTVVGRRPGAESSAMPATAGKTRLDLLEGNRDRPRRRRSLGRPTRARLEPAAAERGPSQLRGPDRDLGFVRGTSRGAFTRHRDRSEGERSVIRFRRALDLLSSDEGRATPRCCGRRLRRPAAYEPRFRDLAGVSPGSSLARGWRRCRVSRKTGRSDSSKTRR